MITGYSLATTVPLVLADNGPADPGGQGDDFGKSSPVGLLLLLVLFVAVIFLIRSMTKHLKRVPESFDEPGPEQPENQAAEPAEESAPEATEKQPEQAAEQPHRTDA